MRTQRQHLIDRAVIHALLQVGSYMLPDATLRAQLTLSAPVVPPPTQAEIDGSIAHHEGERRLVKVVGEYGVKLKISDGGRAWAAEEGIA